MRPEQCAGLNILIWGIGSHGGGLADALFLHQHGAHIHLLDSKSPEQLPVADAQAQHYAWPWHQGDASHSILHEVDLIIVSPAVPPRALPHDRQLLQKISSSMQLFFLWHQGRHLAITGTKGKSSTAHATAAFLQWPLAGNSHGSVLQALDQYGVDNNYIIEISSFQLWYLHNSTIQFQTVIITNIDQDHLDWHEHLADYQACKHWLGQHADDVINHAYIEQHHICTATGWNYQQEIIAKYTELPNCGPHMQLNIAKALAAAIHEGADISHIHTTIPTLQPLAHRQEVVHQCEKLIFINDSAATCPQAVLAAITSIAEPRVFILGGHNKGGDFSVLSSVITDEKIRCVLLGQAAADLIAADIHGPICESLEAAMETAANMLADNNGTIVLSPGCASFGMFTDCAQRGERFRTFAQQRWPTPALTQSQHLTNPQTTVT